MKTHTKIIIIIVVLLAIFYAFNTFIYSEKQGDGPALSPQDATYVIGGGAVKLTEGLSEVEAAPGSASMITTRYFGNDVSIDLNDDGREDSVFLLTQETGGTGTFFYAVAALNTENGYEGSQGLLLGDRIAPQSTYVEGNHVIVSYGERKQDDSFTDEPTEMKSIRLMFDPEYMSFGEVVEDFEGEADPNVMTLDMHTWTWIRTQYNNDTEVAPNQSDAFKLTLSADGTFSATTDCNSLSGSYTSEGNSIEFGPIAMTRMFCEGSQELEFSKMIEEAKSYLFTSRGELVLELPLDTGSVIFR